MALTVTKMTRVFQFNGIRLPDPNPEMSVDNVKALYSAQYPELTTSTVLKLSATRCAIRSIERLAAKVDASPREISIG